MFHTTGYITLIITSADIGATLSAFHGSGIYVYDVVYCDDLSVRCTIQRKHFKAVAKILEKKGEQWKLLHKSGLYYFLIPFIKRPVLLSGLMILLFLTFFLPSRVLFFEVTGNQTVPITQILQAAQSSGIRFGANRRGIRSEDVKNKLLEQLPSIQWLGINTRGCVAVLSVEEKSVPEDSEVPEGSVTSIVASTDGIIDSYTVYSGTPLCKAGDAVKKGQVLVSGYTDCGISIRAGAAKAEIYANTLHSILTVTPSYSTKRLDAAGKSRNITIIIGKKQINFSKDSGISDASCVKMKTEYPLTLPGGFQIPVSLVLEEITSYKTQIKNNSEFNWLPEYSDYYLRSQMNAGSIVSKTDVPQYDSGIYRLKTDYRCYEMIGKVKDEEIIH